MGRGLIRQGIPMGLSGVLPLILKAGVTFSVANVIGLKEKSVSYNDLGTFSLNSYPFSRKLKKLVDSFSRPLASP